MTTQTNETYGLSTTPADDDDVDDVDNDDEFDDINAVIGGHARWNINDKWSLAAYGDVGTGDSDITWQTIGRVGYSFDRWDLTAGYRFLRWEFDEGDNDLLEDVDLKGPYAGAIFRF